METRGSGVNTGVTLAPGCELKAALQDVGNCCLMCSCKLSLEDPQGTMQFQPSVFVID